MGSYWEVNSIIAKNLVINVSWDVKGCNMETIYIIYLYTILYRKSFKFSFQIKK